MACIATWPFGYQAVSAALVVVEKGGSCIEALKAGITTVENDASLGARNVGRGNFPNASGFPQYDGAVMRGSDCKIGAVGALEHCPNALNVACSVLEKSRHSFLVGAGATAFAQTQGFPMESHEDLLKSGTTVDSISNFPTEPSLPIQSPSHDTISMIVLDQQGDLACGVSTSGIVGKEVGRVGDASISGSGFYADNMYGSCCATGNGDIIMQYCPCFHVVMLMRYQGLSPQLACEEVIKEMVKRNNGSFMVALIAMDPKGKMGASGTINTTDRGIKRFEGFPAALWDNVSKNFRIETFPNIVKDFKPN